MAIYNTYTQEAIHTQDHFGVSVAVAQAAIWINGTSTARFEWLEPVMAQDMHR